MKEIKQYMAIYREINGLSFKDKIDSTYMIAWLRKEFEWYQLIKQCGFRNEEDFSKSIIFACKHF